MQLKDLELKKEKKTWLVVAVSVLLVLGLLAYLVFFKEGPLTKEDARKLVVQRLEEAQIAEQLKMLLRNSDKCSFNDFFEKIKSSLSADSVEEKQIERLKPELEKIFSSYKACSPQLDTRVSDKKSFFVVSYFFVFPENCLSPISDNPVLSVKVNADTRALRIIEGEYFQGSSGKFTEQNIEKLQQCIGPYIAGTKVLR